MSGSGRASRPLLGLRLLIVEDAWLVADTLAVQLEKVGASVLGPFATAAKAIEFLKDQPVDFALVDLSLADGFADSLVDVLVERQVPFAILTGFRSLPTNADEHAVATLGKPFNVSELIAILSRTILTKPAT